ncbi:MAG: hypothetical protein V4687_00650 [Bacteroidota bacterium]
MKILITGGKSLQALKMLKNYPNDTVVLADYGDMPVFPSSTYRFVSLGMRNDDITAHNLLTVCLDEAVDAVVPLYAIEIDELEKSKILFEEFSISIINPAADQLIL